MALFAAMLLVTAVPSFAASVSQIDVEGRLDNDGRFHVTELHRMTLGKGAESDFRVFGLSVDQTVQMKAITRIDADGAEHPLVDRVGQEVEGPDQYRYYPLGHVYFRYPAIAEETTFAYRFEYELVNAVSPAWGLGAGWEPLSPESGYGSPWQRLQEIVADAREARRDPKRRYRLDHDVLFPDGSVWKVAGLEINYRLVFDTAWREVDPQAELARVTPSRDYRVRRLFEYLAPGAPAAAANRQAATRFMCIAAVIGIGLLLYLAIVLSDAAMRLLRPLDPSTVAEQLTALAPEEVEAKAQGKTPVMSLDRVLGRLAGERKIAIEAVQAATGDGPGEVRLQLLVRRESLPAFERELIGELFEENQDVTSSDRIRERASVLGRHPDEAMRELIKPAVSKPMSRVSFLALPLLGVALWGVVRQVSDLPHLDSAPVVVVCNVLALVIAFGWPKRWRYGGRRSLGLLAPLALLATLFGALHFWVNRPYAAEVWVGSAISILACHLAQLLNSRVPMRGLAGVARYAQAELRSPTPRLDDRWLPHLLALGLGPQIDRWRQEHGGAAAAPPSKSYESWPACFDGVPFTGRLPEPFVGPPGWADGLFVPADDDDEFDDEELEGEEPELDD